MIRWFRRKRPAPPIQEPSPLIMSRNDAITVLAWGINPPQWASMTDAGRAWHRDNVTKAPHFTTSTNAR